MAQELKTGNTENKMGIKEQLILLGIIIFLIIVIVLGVIVRTGSFS